MPKGCVWSAPHPVHLEHLFYPRPLGVWGMRLGMVCTTSLFCHILPKHKKPYQLRLQLGLLGTSPPVNPAPIWPRKGIASLLAILNVLRMGALAGEGPREIYSPPRAAVWHAASCESHYRATHRPWLYIWRRARGQT
jgi:hypothetical protein